MKKEYTIEGMTCGSCAAKVQTALQKLPQVISVEVDKATDTAQIESSIALPLDLLNSRLNSLDPKYSIAPIGHTADMAQPIIDQPRPWFESYKPILLIFSYLTTVTLLIQFIGNSFDYKVWMRHFMAAFFLVFSFFKLLNLSGFADSYMGYDIIAKRWRGWAYIYAFIELGLGLAYVLNCCPLETNVVAFTVMTISLIGVLQSVLNKRQIQCACLGAVFDLPMSTITIIEDALMIAMSGYMILQYLG